MATNAPIEPTVGMKIENMEIPGTFWTITEILSPLLFQITNNTGLLTFMRTAHFRKIVENGVARIVEDAADKDAK